MHVSACLWLLPLLATINVFTRLYDVSSSRHVIPTPTPTPTPRRTSALMDCHLSITSILKHFANMIEYGITSLHSRECKQTWMNIIKHSRAHHRPCKKADLCQLAYRVHVLVVCATNVAANPQTSRGIFHSDSIPIRVDNCATTSISNDL